MKKWEMSGSVSRTSAQDVVSQDKDGNVNEKTIYILRVDNENSGSSVTIRQGRPFDMNVGEDVEVNVTFGAQTRLDEIGAAPSKGKRKGESKKQKGKGTE